MLKAVIFDMDGVIINSEPLHARAGVMACEKFGISIDTDFCYDYIGSPAITMCSDIVKKWNMEISAKELLHEMNICKRTLEKTEGYSLIPGISSLMENLHKNNIMLAIASSSIMSDIEETLKTNRLSKYIDHIVSGADLKNPKPAPDIYIETLKKMGVSPKEAVVIEDSDAGIMAAKDAGLPCLGFFNKDSGNQTLKDAFQLTNSFEGMDVSYFENMLKRYLGKPITIVKTKRLTIRELAVEDIPAIYQIYENKEVRSFVEDLDEYMEQEIEKHKAYIKNVYGFYGYGLWGVYSRNQKLIGRCGIENTIIDKEAVIQLSYLLDYNHWGMGYALECTTAVLDYAFNELDIKEVTAVVDVLNTRSISLLEKLGMTNEKTIIYHDRTCYFFRLKKKDYINKL